MLIAMLNAVHCDMHVRVRDAKSGLNAYPVVWYDAISTFMHRHCILAVTRRGPVLGTKSEDLT